MSIPYFIYVILYITITVVIFGISAVMLHHRTRVIFKAPVPHIHDIIGKTLSAHKAYLVHSKTAETSKAMRMVFADEETTGIISLQTSQKENATDGIYNISGQRLSKMQNGINIVNGKKVVVK